MSRICMTLFLRYLGDDREGSHSKVKGFALFLEYGSQSCNPRIPFWVIVIMFSGMPEWMSDLL